VAKDFKGTINLDVRDPVPDWGRLHRRQGAGWGAPEKVEQLEQLWLEEAKANNVLPLNDMKVAGKDLQEFTAMEFKIPVPPSGQYTYYPGTAAVPERRPRTSTRSPTRCSPMSSSRRRARA
jgi:hypothetical protein